MFERDGLMITIDKELKRPHLFKRKSDRNSGERLVLGRI